MHNYLNDDIYTTTINEISYGGYSRRQKLVYRDLTKLTSGQDNSCRKWLHVGSFVLLFGYAVL